jgi:hypothetical protein
VGTESRISIQSKVGKVQKGDHVLDLGSQERTELETAGVNVKEDIPLVLQQIVKISSLNKLHASVSQIEFKEQHSPRGKIKTLSRKLEIDKNRQILVGEYFRIQDRISCKANSNKFTTSNHPIREGKKYSKFGRRGNAIKKSSRVCSISDIRSVCHSFVCAPQERRRNETNLQPEKPEPIRDLQSLQDGRFSGCKKSHTKGGLAMQSGSQGCILLHTNPLGSQKVSEVSSKGPDATVPQSPIRTGISPTAFHKNNETDHCPTQANSCPSSDLLR